MSCSWDAYSQVISLQDLLSLLLNRQAASPHAIMTALAWFVPFLLMLVPAPLIVLLHSHCPDSSTKGLSDTFRWLECRFTILFIPLSWDWFCLRLTVYEHQCRNGEALELTSLRFITQLDHPQCKLFQMLRLLCVTTLPRVNYYHTTEFWIIFQPQLSSAWTLTSHLKSYDFTLAGMFLQPFP